MQALFTRLRSGGNGQRITVSCQAKTIRVGWDYEKDVTDNHDAAVLELVKELEWDASCYPSRLVRSENQDGSGFVYQFCFDAPVQDCIKTRPSPT